MTEDQHAEIQTLGMMRAAHKAAEMAVPKDLVVRAQWLDVLKALNKAVLAQWCVTDSFVSSGGDQHVQK